MISIYVLLNSKNRISRHHRLIETQAQNLLIRFHPQELQTIVLLSVVMLSYAINRQYTYIAGKCKHYLNELQKQEEGQASAEFFWPVSRGVQAIVIFHDNVRMQCFCYECKQMYICTHDGKSIGQVEYYIIVDQHLNVSEK